MNYYRTPSATDSKAVDRVLTIIFVSLVLALWGVVSTADYSDARRVECAQLKLSYDPAKDVCLRK